MPMSLATSFARLALCLAMASVALAPAAEASRIFRAGQLSFLEGVDPLVASGVAPAFSDAFSGITDGVDITTRAPDTGSNWAADATSSSARFDDSGLGRAYAHTSATGNMQLGVTPTDADYTLTGGLVFRTGSASATAALIVRGNTGAGTTLQGYACRWTPSTTTTGTWVVGSYATGTFTAQGTNSGIVTIVTGNSPITIYAMSCAVTGSTVTLTVNGVQKATWTDAGNLYPSTGRLMARLSVAGSQSTGFQWDSIGYAD